MNGEETRKLAKEARVRAHALTEARVAFGTVNADLLMRLADALDPPVDVSVERREP